MVDMYEKEPWKIWLKTTTADMRMEELKKIG